MMGKHSINADEIKEIMFTIQITESSEFTKGKEIPKKLEAEVKHRLIIYEVWTNTLEYIGPSLENDVEVYNKF